MYIAMNRFRIRQGFEADFETIWRERETHLDEMKGFKGFHLLRGPKGEDGTVLYASHTVWESEADFIAWTKSENFRAAHKNANPRRELYAGPPQFEGFSSVEGI